MEGITTYILMTLCVGAGAGNIYAFMQSPKSLGGAVNLSLFGLMMVTLFQLSEVFYS